MSIKSKLATLAWFLQRPPFWSHAAQLILRSFQRNYDDPVHRDAATAWAASRATSLEDCLTQLQTLTGASLSATETAIEPKLLEEAWLRSERVPVKMGGAGDLPLLYATCAMIRARAVVETGVAYGWSSLAILAALAGTGGRLVSVDMPYVKQGNEPWVGIVVPSELRGGWTLIREPDRNGLRKALGLLGGSVDLCHYDSDKSYPGRMWAYPLLWEALRPGGVFISDDIQDNFAFRDFVARRSVRPVVIESQGKFVGVCVRPLDHHGD
jgi:predicted O-methyltransferase YrrM